MTIILISRCRTVPLSRCAENAWPSVKLITVKLPAAPADSVASLSAGSLSFVAGGLVLLLPETKGIPLPDTIDDIEFPER